MQPSNIQIDQPWLTQPGVQDVMQALTSGGGIARFVGGCVRDAMFHRPIRDIDIATDQTPDQVIALLSDADLRHAPTGLAHGTITAIAAGQGYEVTTLRVDQETDGRRAKVAFTEDWLGDAQRRDFTMNALYCDPDGTVYDPVGGIEDIAAGRVRFIGDARARIEEDYLRILRFFRFHAWYGGSQDIDPDGLSACAENKDNLGSLSIERVRTEFMRLLAAEQPVPTLRHMSKAGILQQILPTDADLGSLQKLVDLEIKHNELSTERRLASLFASNRAAIAGHASGWKMSNAEKKRLRAISKGRDVSQVTRQQARQIIYQHTAKAFIDDLFLWSDDMKGDLLDLARQWPVPNFPISGDDVIALGVDAGEQVGVFLRSLEDQWVAEDFVSDRKELLTQLKAMIAEN
jgi:poly(A) polymerase